ncbi:hypothetical protein BLNAU_19645 [Blattamonas nauphoetae]|uniref:Uncharacterized protein n=1 Tax=Blattamonas nauphoetae TaxID=2049346 RepID=A0ABQ9X0X4_9EUKA|nr:hypothetical protein BLNAU_19645 [Blattamonas nauphoetae]
MAILALLFRCFHFCLMDFVSSNSPFVHSFPTLDQSLNTTILPPNHFILQTLSIINRCVLVTGTENATHATSLHPFDPSETLNIINSTVSMISLRVFFQKSVYATVDQFSSLSCSDCAFLTSLTTPIIKNSGGTVILDNCRISSLEGTFSAPIHESVTNDSIFVVKNLSIADLFGPASSHLLSAPILKLSLSMCSFCNLTHSLDESRKRHERSTEPSSFSISSSKIDSVVNALRGFVIPDIHSFGDYLCTNTTFSTIPNHNTYTSENYTEKQRKRYDVTFTKCTFDNCRGVAENGGALSWYGPGLLYITNSTFQNCSTPDPYSGGNIFAYSADNDDVDKTRVYLHDVSSTNSSAKHGGLFYADKIGDVRIVESSISLAEGKESSGAIRLQQISTSAYISSCSFRRCSATNYGMAVSLSLSKCIYVTNCTFQENTLTVPLSAQTIIGGALTISDDRFPNESNTVLLSSLFFVDSYVSADFDTAGIPHDVLIGLDVDEYEVRSMFSSCYSISHHPHVIHLRKKATSEVYDICPEPKNNVRVALTPHKEGDIQRFPEEAKVVDPDPTTATDNVACLLGTVSCFSLVYSMNAIKNGDTTARSVFLSNGFHRTESVILRNKSITVKGVLGEKNTDSSMLKHMTEWNADDTSLFSQQNGNVTLSSFVYQIPTISKDIYPTMPCFCQIFPLSGGAIPILHLISIRFVVQPSTSDTSVEFVSSDKFHAADEIHVTPLITPSLVYGIDVQLTMEQLSLLPSPLENGTLYVPRFRDAMFNIKSTLSSVQVELDNSTFSHILFSANGLLFLQATEKSKVKGTRFYVNLFNVVCSDFSSFLVLPTILNVQEAAGNEFDTWLDFRKVKLLRCEGEDASDGSLMILSRCKGTIISLTVEGMSEFVEPVIRNHERSKPDLIHNTRNHSTHFTSAKAELDAVSVAFHRYLHVTRMSYLTPHHTHKHQSSFFSDSQHAGGHEFVHCFPAGASILFDESQVTLTSCHFLRCPFTPIAVEGNQSHIELLYSTFTSNGRKELDEPHLHSEKRTGSSASNIGEVTLRSNGFAEPEPPLPSIFNIFCTENASVTLTNTISIDSYDFSAPFDNTSLCLFTRSGRIRLSDQAHPHLPSISFIPSIDNVDTTNKKDHISINVTGKHFRNCGLFLEIFEVDGTEPSQAFVCLPSKISENTLTVEIDTSLLSSAEWQVRLLFPKGYEKATELVTNSVPIPSKNLQSFLGQYSNTASFVALNKKPNLTAVLTTSAVLAGVFLVVLGLTFGLGVWLWCRKRRPKTVSPNDIHEDAIFLLEKGRTNGTF